MHDDMTCKVIRGQGQGQEMTSVPFGTILRGLSGNWMDTYALHFQERESVFWNR